MKKLTLILLAFVMTLTSCKPEPEENNNGGNNGDNTNKVKVSCTIPINKGTRSDFTGLFEDGVINWSDGRECVYLAIPGDEPKVVELEGYCDGYKPVIEFIAYVDENLLTAGESYDIWYFGHSQQLDEPYVSLINGNKIEGNIVKQTGRLEDLGYSHIASTSVKAVMENGEVRLPLIGTLKNRMAIALVDLYTVTELKGTAVNTDYALEYNVETGKYEFNIVEDANATIEIEDALYGISYLALLPNENNKVVLEGDKYAHDCEYTFYTGIKENKIYHKLDENENITFLTWGGENLPFGYVNGYEYVDLGLPSGLKWAAYNIGATSSEEYGNYYAWGEINTKDSYNSGSFISTSTTGYEISGSSKYDAARANWGENWKMPSATQMRELTQNCTWEWVQQGGINGYKVIGTNGASIFLPAAGFRYESSLSDDGVRGLYRTSTVEKYVISYPDYSYMPTYMNFNSNSYGLTGDYNFYYGYSIRPVIK